MSHQTSDTDYQAVQQIYLDWHSGKRPLSGFVNDIMQLIKAHEAEAVQAARIDEVNCLHELTKQEFGYETPWQLKVKENRLAYLQGNTK